MLLLLRCSAVSFCTISTSADTVSEKIPEEVAVHIPAHLLETASRGKSQRLLSILRFVPANGERVPSSFLETPPRCEITLI
ncbi:hypothetical protein GGR57DRAFT_471536 [Xylariaceae sp. FL1272]|nr:hypothetical protein GGR57DRAFT_471536 [Xylariaceae sp. FL1272]